MTEQELFAAYRNARKVTCACGRLMDPTSQQCRTCFEAWDEATFWAKVDKSGECWIWTGKRVRNRYGQAVHPAAKRRRDGNRGFVYAHRIAYQLLVGPIAEGLELDHLCRNPPCVNPAHLEPVTHAENQRRLQRPTCKRGHVYDEANTRYRPGRPTNRICRACARENYHKYAARKRDDHKRDVLHEATVRHWVLAGAAA